MCIGFQCDQFCPGKIAFSKYVTSRNHQDFTPFKNSRIQDSEFGFFTVYINTVHADATEVCTEDVSSAYSVI